MKHIKKPVIKKAQDEGFDIIGCLDDPFSCIFRKDDKDGTS